MAKPTAYLGTQYFLGKRRVTVEEYYAKQQPDMKALKRVERFRNEHGAESPPPKEPGAISPEGGLNDAD